MGINLYQEAIGGLSAGILGTVIGYPLDLVKTRMQTGKKAEFGMIKIGSNIIKKGKYVGIILIICLLQIFFEYS